ncbi:MAG: four helix bundle protein [Opitutae bacterium]
MEKGKKIEGFEDLIVWQLAIDLAASVYTAFETCRDFPLRDQVQRAAVSISSNIAEGYERDSNADFIRFLYYAKGSCGEVRSQLYLAHRVRALADQTASGLIEQARLLSRKLGAYIKIRETKFS